MRGSGIQINRQTEREIVISYSRPTYIYIHVLHMQGRIKNDTGESTKRMTIRERD